MSAALNEHVYRSPPMATVPGMHWATVHVTLEQHWLPKHLHDADALVTRPAIAMRTTSCVSPLSTPKIGTDV